MSELRKAKKQAQKHIRAREFQQARTLLLRFSQAGLPDAEFWTLLGSANLGMNNLVEAAANLRQAVTLGHDDADACFDLANVLMQLGHVGDAIQNYRRVVQLRPRHESAWHKLGLAYARAGLYSESADCLRRTIAIKPDNLEARVNLGIACERLGRWDEACEVYREALALDPENLRAHQCLFNGLLSGGRLQDAAAHYRYVLTLFRGNTDVMAGLASVYERMREYDQAYEALRPALESGSRDVAVGCAYAGIARQTGRTRDAIAWLEKIRSSDIAAPERARFYFQLARLYESEGEYERAFSCFGEANAAQRPDEAMLERFASTYSTQVEESIRIFTPEFMRSVAKASDGSRVPIFIVGMPRSGTSLVEQILASHPGVHGAGELDTMSDVAKLLARRIGGNQGYPGCMRNVSAADMEAASRHYLRAVASLAPNAARVTDKMPHNFLLLGLIHLLFPNAAILHCTRDVMDTCLSIYCNYFPDWHVYSTDLTVLGRYYRAYEKLMSHWREVLAIPMLEVRYEDLVQEPERNIRAMLEFCQLEWDTRCLTFHRNQRYVNTLSYEQVRRPMYTDAIGRWRHYHGYLEPLRAALEVPL
jgi:tetratricopeptide (TPR) repeat protein